MAGSSEIDRLITVFDARSDQLEAKLNKVIRAHNVAADKIRKSMDGAAGGWSKGLEKGLADVEGRVTGLAGRMPVLGGALTAAGVAGAAAGVAIGGFVLAMERAREAAQSADDLVAMADKIGVSAEALQELRHAAEANDIPLDKLDDGLRALNGSIGALQTGVGAGKLKAAFASIGIDPAQLKSIQTADQLLPVLADKIQALGSQAAQVQITRKLGIEELLPLLQQGAAGVERFRNQARELGLVLDEGTLRSVADLNEGMRLADERVRKAGDAFALSLVPILTDVKTGFAEAMTKGAEFFNWLERKIAPGRIGNIDGQIADVTNKVNAARMRANAFRNGTDWSAMVAGMAPVEFLKDEQAARDRHAREEERRIGILEAQLVVLTTRREFANAAPPPAGGGGGGGGGGFGSGGGSGGKPKKVKDDPGRIIFVDGDAIRDLEMANRMEVARIAGRTKAVELLQDEVDLRRMIETYERAGLSHAEAQARAQEQLNTIVAARRTAAAIDKQLNPADFVDAKTLHDKFNGMAVDLKLEDASISQMRDDFRDAFKGGLWAAINGGDLGDYLRNWFMDRIFSGAEGLLDKVADGIFNSTRSGGGGVLAGAFKFLGFAGGGDHPTGEPYVVGENGPEIRVDKSRGSILSNSVLRQLVAMGGVPAGGGQVQQVMIDARGALIWEGALAEMRAYADQVAVGAGVRSYQAALRDSRAQAGLSAANRLGR